MQGFQSVGPLATGGMGTVELALRREGSFERTYVIKRLRPELSGDAAVRQMFLSEARIAGLLRHPNVVSVLDVQLDARGPLLVMEYVPSLTAADLLRWAAQGARSLPIQLCVDIARQAAEGLHAAHELRDHTGVSLHVVHRDISPQNLLLGFDGLVRVTDFGIAKALSEGDLATTSGLLKGKVGYISPEQLRFQPVDRRSDLYSLGVVLYELLSGTRMRRGRSIEELARQGLETMPPDIGSSRDDVPPLLVALLFALLAPNPADRIGTARELADDLTAIADQLARDEGRTSLREYMNDHLAELRHGRELLVETMLTRARTASAARPDAPEKAPSKPLSRWLAVGGALVAAGTLAGALIVATAPEVPVDAKHESTPAATSPPTTAQPTPATAMSPTSEAGPVAEPNRASPTAPPLPTVDEPPIPTPTAMAERTRPRRPRARMERRAPRNEDRNVARMQVQWGEL